MGEVFLTLLHMSVTAGYMILAVVALRVILKKAPKWIICLLWGLVGVRLACPVSVKSVFSLIPRGESVPRETAAAPYGAFDPGPAVFGEAANSVVASAEASNAAAHAPRTDVFITAVSAVWLAGVAVMLVCALVSYMKLKRSVATAVPSKDGVFVCDEIAAPFLFGLFRPAIYVPAHLPEETLQNVVEHETAHFKRGDHLWKPLGYLLLAAHWFNPLCWLAYMLLCRDIEAACDEKVIRRKDKAGLAAYSQALLDCSFQRAGVSAYPLAFGEVGVKQRVRSVLGYKKPKLRVLLTAAVLCALVVASLMTDPVAAAISFALPEGVTEIAVTHILGGKTEEHRAGGKALRRWNVWLSGLRGEEAPFAPDKTPGDVNGGERYVITASAPNGSAQYVYIKDENGDVWLLADAAWYAVQNPCDPPAAYSKAALPAGQAADDVPLPQTKTALPELTAAQTAQEPAKEATAPSAGNGSISAKPTAAPEASPEIDALSELPAAAQTVNSANAQAQDMGGDNVTAIPQPSNDGVGDGEVETSLRYVYISIDARKKEAAEPTTDDAVVENIGPANVTVRAGDDLYTVYGERDNTGHLRISSNEYYYDVVQESSEPVEEASELVEEFAGGVEDPAGAVEAPSYTAPTVLADDQS